MRRGDLYWIDLDPTQGSEANKVRPAVVVSNDAANRVAVNTGRGVITVVPVTSNTHRILPFQALLPADTCGLKGDSKAQAEQVRSLAIGRVRDHIGTLPEDLLAQLDQALRLHLSL